MAVHTPVDHQSSPLAKIALLRSLFRGRDDMPTSTSLCSRGCSTGVVAVMKRLATQFSCQPAPFRTCIRTGKRRPLSRIRSFVTTLSRAGHTMC